MLHSEIIRYLGIVCVQCVRYTVILSHSSYLNWPSFFWYADYIISFFTYCNHTASTDRWCEHLNGEALWKEERGFSPHTPYYSYATLYRFLYWFWEKNRLFCSLSVSRLWGGARVVQWWKHSPPTNVAWVQIRVLTPYVSWVCSWFYPLPWVVFFGHSGFPLASKPNISTPNWTRNARPRISSLMCYLSIFIYFINFINIIKGHLKEFSLFRGAGILLF